MNFLAHCALTQDASDCWENGDALRSGLLAGAILADFGKGPIASKWPLELQAGVRLHRRIDAFTNQHGVIREHLRIVSSRASTLRADFPRHSR